MRTRNNRGNIFVGNLPRDFPDDRLAEAFDPHGIVLSATVARDPATGGRLRYGFVDIATERAANAAISALDGTEIDGCRLNVRPSERPAKKAPGEIPPRRRQPVRRAAPMRTAEADAPAPDAAGEPVERAFQVKVVRRRPPTFQVERRPLPRRI